jgi:aldose 1-epimerase
MEFIRKVWGQVKDTVSELFIVRDPETGFEVQITDIGASIVRVKVPDRNGVINDIHYGKSSPIEVFNGNGYLGSVVGRTASFLYFATFQIDGVTYNVDQNFLLCHHQHGGFNGFNKQIWKCIQTSNDEDNVIIQFQYVSRDGECGYPGTLTTNLTYTITSEMELIWEFKSTTDKPTIVNLINHAYWNLDGIYNLINDMELKINASRYFMDNKKLIVANTILHKLNIKKKHIQCPFILKEVSGYDIDLHQAHLFSDLFNSIGDLDHVFLLDSDQNPKKVIRETDPLQFAAELYSPRTGRCLTVTTTEPCLVVYSGNSMDTVKSFGKVCKKHGAVCLETSRFTSGIMLPEYQDLMILRPNSTYYHKTINKFSIR